MTRYIKHLRDEGKAVIISTHYLDEAQRLCDRFGLVHRGRLVMEGSLEELRERTGAESLVEIFLQLAAAKPSETPESAEKTHVAAIA